MAKSSSSSMEVYINSLDLISLSRYKDKISQIGGVDPYQLPTAAFTSDHDMLPSIRNEDIVEYLVFSKSSYTMTEFKSMKSLQAHNQMTSGFVHDLWVHNPLHSSNILVTAKVSFTSFSVCVHHYMPVFISSSNINLSFIVLGPYSFFNVLTNQISDTQNLRLHS